MEVLLSQSMLCKSGPSEACLPAACLLDLFLNIFLLFPFSSLSCSCLSPSPTHANTCNSNPPLVSCDDPPSNSQACSHKSGLVPAVFQWLSTYCWMERFAVGFCLPSRWAHKPVHFLPAWLPVSTTSRETPFPPPNKIEIGQWFQKSAREMGIGFRDPINLLFLGSYFGKVSGLKTTDYSIEKDTLFCVIQDWIK